jgi:hypothetical protein
MEPSEKTLLDYTGYIDYNMIDQLVERLKKQKGFTDLNRKTGKRVYAIVVECLENIAKHSVVNPVNSARQPHIYVTKKSNEIVIRAGNPVVSDEKERLMKELDLINNLEECDLLSQYDNKINTENGSGKNGAGLGFMLIRLKSGNKIGYSFSDLDNHISFFEITITIKEYSMRKLIVDQTTNSPRVIFDPDKNRYEISGESRPPDVAGFYSEILSWIDDYSHHLLKSKEDEPVFFNLDFEYFNSSSAKYILDLCKKIAEVRTGGKNINVKWHYEDDDTDMLEVGKEMSKMARFPFEYVVKIKK